ncbi:MAG: hypothetical protein ACE5FH_10665 [Candidatus Zixiibacteriota bacterium]
MRLLIVAWFAISLMVSCTSRYRLDLYMTIDEVRRRVAVETTEYVLESRLGDPYTENPLLPGETNCIIITTGARGQTRAEKESAIVGFDEYLRCRVYLELPAILHPDTISLEQRSFVQLLGRYDRPRDEKIFLPVSGDCLIDSITTTKLFATIDGRFENNRGEVIALGGRFRVKIGN